MERNLTEGSVLKTVIYFSLPYLLSYFLQTLYGMADLFIIGQFNGVDSTTAVSVGSQVMHMLTVIIIGLAMGTTVMTGRAVGEGNRRKISCAIGNTITLFAILAAVFTVVLLLSVNGIISLISTPTEAVPQAKDYLIICFIGIPFITAYNIISSVFRGIGDTKSPMYFVAVACVFNIILDYVFIGFFKLGAAGAALGTTLSQTVSVIISLAAIRKKQMLPKITKSDLKPDRATMGSLLKIGIPVAVQDGFIQVSFIVITIFANRRGLNDAAAVGIVEKLIGIFFLIPSSMLSTVSALSAQNIGAGKPERAVLTLKYAAIIAVVFGLTTSMAMQFFAENAVSLFSSDSTVIQLGGEYMHSYVWDCVFAGINFSFCGYFCACGLSNIPFMNNCISILAVRIPVAYMASKFFTDSLFPMGLASPLGSLLSVFISVTAYMWLKRHPEKVMLNI